MKGGYRRKQSINKSVLEESLDRLRHLYDSFDTVVVSFSGGKDSTAMLNLALMVAEEKGKLPVRAVFFDEEVIHPPTIEYVERVRRDPRIQLDWYCLPVKHRNACSNKEPYWYAWDPSKRDLWVRDLPENVITEHPKFEFGMSFQEFSPLAFAGNICVLQGIRTEESIRRYRMVTAKKNDNYIVHYKKSSSAFPIYDWSSSDVWKLIEVYGFDYNKTYDLMNRTRLYNRLLAQRVCPPFGEEPLRGLWMYKECFPEMWAKMTRRVAGVNTAALYSNTELYTFGSKPPEGMTWKEYAHLIIDNYVDLAVKNQVREQVNKLVKLHYQKTAQPIEDAESNPLTGVSWRFLCKMVIKGDLKGRQSGAVQKMAIQAQQKLGITAEEALKLYGRKPTK